MATPDLQTLETVRPWVNCLVCDSPRFSDYIEGRGYRIVRCRECGLRFINPQPSEQELTDFYRGFDDQGNTWRGDGEERFDRAVRDFILRFKKEGSILDIGSSRGNFLIAMRGAGFSVYGVEPSPQNSGFARSVNGIPTYTGTVEQFLNAPPRTGFDVITILNVLEHVRSPKEVLLGLSRLLVDSGLLVIDVPDARLHAVIGQTRGMLGFSDPFWMNTTRHPLVGFDPPCHLASFAPKTISLLVDRCGFQKLDLRNAPVIINQDTWKNATKTALHACSELLFAASLGRIVAGYSTLIAARKIS